jgi:hypothetical protein
MNKFNIGDIVKCDTDKEFTVSGMRLHAGNILYFSDVEGIVGRSEEDLTLVERHNGEVFFKPVPIMNDFNTDGILKRRYVSREEFVSKYYTPEMLNLNSDFVDSINYATKDLSEKILFTPDGPLTGAAAVRALQHSDHLTFDREYLNELCTEFEKVTRYTPELTDTLTQPLNTDYPKLILRDKLPLRKTKQCNHEWVATQLFTSTVHDCKLCGAKK